jgi:HD-GYP domain-containing protein (c-di-GMP phosphodiesterase class II)
MKVAREHDADLHRHSILVGSLTAAFGAHLGLSPVDQSVLVKAALLHDIGKIKVSRELLCKPAALTSNEMAAMRLHPKSGYLLLTAEGGHDTETLAVVRLHHERLDGSGYPDGLLAIDIPEPVRIVTLCDIYAAMTEPRPYVVPFESREALTLMAMKLTRLDLRLMKEFAAMVSTKLPPQNIFH